MWDSRRWLLVGLSSLSAACAFDTSAGTNVTVDDTETEGASESGTQTQGTDPSGPSSAGSHGGSGDDTGGETGGSTGDDTTPDPTADGMERADLVFVEEAPIDLGVHPLSGPDVLTLQLVNEGDAAASILGGEDPPAPLIWAGDAFPGTDGTCQGLIPPGATCTVTLAVAAGQPGLTTGAVEVRFDDAIGVGTASAAAQLVATGSGPNLIENADAEADPPGVILTGWDAEDSSFRTSDEHNHGTGSLSFFAGGSDNPEITQELVLSPWADSIDTLAMQFHFQGWSRSRDDTLSDDPHGITLLMLDGGGQVLANHNRDDMDHDGWESTVFNVPLPVGTRRVRVRLTCERNDWIIGNSNCSAWFDDFSGALHYTP